MHDERVDHTTGNIWGRDDTGNLVLVGNINDMHNAIPADKVTTSMSKKEGLMQSCCSEYNNIHPVSWRDMDGKWHLAWRCEICQRTMDLVVNAKNSFPYIVSGSPMTIPKDAIVIEHTKPDLQQIRALEMGADIYRSEREKAVPSELVLFEGACPNCAYQPLSGKATADHSTVYKCNTCGVVYKIRETGEYCRYFGTTDLDVVEDTKTSSAPVTETPTDNTEVETSDVAAMENLHGTVAPVNHDDAALFEKAETEPTNTTFTEEHTSTEDPQMSQTTDGMVHPTITDNAAPVTIAPLHEILDDRSIPDQSTPPVATDMDSGIPASALDAIDLSSAMSAGLDQAAPIGKIDMQIPDASLQEKMSVRSKTSASDIINTGTSTVTEIRVSVKTSDTDSPIVAKTENVVAVYGHVTSILFVHDHVPTDDAIKYTMHPSYDGEPATFMKVVTSAVVPGENNNVNTSSFTTMIQVHPDIHVEIEVMSHPYMKSVAHQPVR